MKAWWLLALVIGLSSCAVADLGGAQPLPEPVGEPRFQELPNGNVRGWPNSQDIPNEGRWEFSAPHCGLDWMIDVDGSFWEAIKPDDYGNGDAYPFFFNADEGTFEFVEADVATYTASTGEEIRLERLEGPIEIQLCG